ncbi:alpha/beta fold hydrolase [Rubrivivax sp. RP6-9]|uniref:alpha/beta fold hydrolase n=1 Tax=Rubrivivax sp. RP6-9 TaxID=3415750 RepID=UPI003CC634B2
MSMRSHAWLSMGAERLARHLADKPNPDAFDCDVLIIGSGYGGAVAAARLAGATVDGQTDEHGQPRRAVVWLLERGAEHQPGRFPSRFSELPGHVRFSRQDGLPARGRSEGLLDLRLGGDVSVLLGNGLGGGSLINAGVMAEPEAAVFDSGWPAAINAASMQAPFEQARRMLGVQTVPATPKLRKLDILERMAARRGEDLRAPLTVNFVPNAKSSAGIEMNPCTMCGDCLTGCNQGAKGSLDTSYLALARQRGAELFCGAAVQSIERDEEDRGWRVRWHYTEPALRPPSGEAFALRARQVVLAAGSLGSSEILLRSSAQLALSPRLGQGFSTNGDSIVACVGHPERVAMAADQETDPADPLARRVGPTITGLHRVPATEDRPSFVIEEFAVPGALRNVFGEIVALLDAVERTSAVAVSGETIGHMSLYGLMGDEGAGSAGSSGTLSLPAAPPGMAPAVEGGARIDWKDVGELSLYKQMRAWVRGAVGDTTRPDPLHPARVVPGQDLVSAGLATAVTVTVHPLGGCGMGADAVSGVVNDRGQAFKADGGVHETLVVLDGSIVPRSLGINPALTITALAERALPLLMGQWCLTAWNDGAVLHVPQRPVTRRREIAPAETVWTLRERVQGLTVLGNDIYWARLEIEFDPVPGLRKALALQERVLGVRRAELRLRAADENTTEFSFDDSEREDADLCVVQLAGQVDLFSQAPTDLPGEEDTLDPRWRLVYRLGVQSVSGPAKIGIRIGDRIEGVKRFGADPGRTIDQQASLWRQLSEMEVKLEGACVGRWALDLGDLARRRDPLLSAARLSSMPDAIDDLAAVVLFTLRLALPTLWKLMDQKIGKAQSTLLDQRKPGKVSGIVPTSYGECGDWCLSRYRPDDSVATPIVLIHGLGTSGSSYTDTSFINLTQTLLQNKRDVWVLDLRSSIANEAGRQQPDANSWTVDSIGERDIPQAIAKVLEQTGDAQVDVFAHCMGAVMFCMAVMGEPALQGRVRSAVLSQVGPLARLSPLNRLRGYVGSYLRGFLDVQELDTAPEYRSAPMDAECKANWSAVERGMPARLLDALLSTFPYPDGESQREFELQTGELKLTGFRAVRHRADAIFGQLFELANMAPATLGRLEALFGWSKTTMLGQAIHFARHEMLVSARGFNAVMDRDALQKRFGFPLLMLHGQNNRVFDWRGSLRSWRLLRHMRGELWEAPSVLPTPSPRHVYGANQRLQLHVFTTYGHLDCVMGEHAHRDVFPVVTQFLRRVDDNDFVAARSGPPSDPQKRQPEPPWLGPVLGWLRQTDSPGRLRARVWVQASPRRARVNGVAVVPLRWAEDGPQLLPGGCWVRWPSTHERIGMFDWDLNLAALDLWHSTTIDTFALMTLHEDMLLGTQLDALAQKQDMVEYGARIDWLAGGRALWPDVDKAIQRWFDEHRAQREWERCLFSLSSSVRQAVDRGAPHPMAPGGTLRFALASCQYPPGLLDQAPAQATWDRLARDLQHREQPPQFLLLAGDQVYVDAQAGVFDPGMAPSTNSEVLAADFDRHYELNWLGASFRRVVARLPVYSMLDDHEVGDNWPGHGGAPGRQPERLQASLDAFDRFQRKLAPDEGWAGTLGYRLFPGGAPLWVLDTRSQRDPRSASTLEHAHILPEASLDQLIAELGAESVKECAKFILSPVPILPPERVVALSVAERLRSDAWSGFPASTARLLGAIRDQGIRRVVFLSGDSHLSSVSSFTFEGEAAPRVVSVVSSGTYAPWPFANQRPEDLILGGAVDLGLTGSPLRGTVKLEALSAADAYALIQLECDAKSGRLALRISLRSDATTAGDCHIVLS